MNPNTGAIGAQYDNALVEQEDIVKHEVMERKIAYGEVNADDVIELAARYVDMAKIEAMIDFYDRYIPSENKEHARSEVVCDGADHINQVRHLGTAYAELADTFDEVLNALNHAANELTGGAFELEEEVTDQVSVKENGGSAESTMRFSIEYDVDNAPFVVVENDILSGVPKTEWVKVVKDNLRRKFPDGITVGENTVVINQSSRREMTFSNYMRRLFKTEPQMYADKLRATDNADEILKAARNWVNEALMHPRVDAIIDFARGVVQLRIGGNDYTAQVIVGNRGKNGLVLYDIINLTPATIQERTKKTGADRFITKAQRKPGDSQSAPAADSVTDIPEKSNSKFSAKVTAADTDSAGASNAKEQDVRFSRKVDLYDYSKPFSEQVDDYAEGKIKKGDTLVISGTPEVFKSVGFNSLPMTIGTRHIDYALNGTKDNDHFWGEESLKELPELLKKPVAIFVSETQPDTSVVALLSKKVNGKQAIAPVIIDGFGVQNGIEIDSNAVASVFGKGNSVDKLLYEAIVNEGKGAFSLLYWNKKEAISLLNVRRLQLPAHIKISDGFIHSIREDASPVKPVINGQTDTKQFKRWFKGSKVVDEDGKPKVLYHGSKSKNATVFEARHGGIFLTESQKYANQYTKNWGYNAEKGEVYPVYVRMANPLDTRNPQIRNLVEKELDIGNSKQEMITSIGLPHAVYAEELSQIAQKHRYDGLILDEIGDDTGIEYGDESERISYVVFSSNQIKSATDNIGTFDGNNPDIRFSRESFPAGEQPRARDVEVPVKVNGRNVSQTVRTVEEAAATPDDLIPTIDGLVQEGVFSYDRVSNKERIAAAEESVRREGFERTLEQWSSAVRAGGVNAENTPLSSRHMKNQKEFAQIVH